LVAQSDNDSFFRAAANLMLNSGSEHLEGLREEYKDKLACSDLNLMNERIYPVDEQQVSDMIENICAQTNQQA